MEIGAELLLQAEKQAQLACEEGTMSGDFMRQLNLLRKSSKPICLTFICDTNRLYSQMAEIWSLHFLRYFEFKRVHIRSAGIRKGHLYPGLSKLLNELDIPAYQAKADQLQVLYRDKSIPFESKTIGRTGFPLSQSICLVMTDEARIKRISCGGREAIYLPCRHVLDERVEQDVLRLFLETGLHVALIMEQLYRSGLAIRSGQKKSSPPDRTICSRIRQWDRTDAKEEEEDRMIASLDIDWNAYCNYLYMQFNHKAGRNRLLQKCLNREYDANLEALALKAIRDKYVDLRTWGFLFLSKGQNRNLLPMLRSKLQDKSPRTRTESAWCIKSIKQGKPELFIPEDPHFREMINKEFDFPVLSKRISLKHLFQFREKP